MSPPEQPRRLGVVLHRKRKPWIQAPENANYPCFLQNVEKTSKENWQFGGYHLERAVLVHFLQVKKNWLRQSNLASRHKQEIHWIFSAWLKYSSLVSLQRCFLGIVSNVRRGKSFTFKFTVEWSSTNAAKKVLNALHVIWSWCFIMGFITIRRICLTPPKPNITPEKWWL